MTLFYFIYHDTSHPPRPTRIPDFSPNAFQKLVQRKVLDDSPASDLSELVDNDSLRLYLDPNDMLWKEWQMLKGEREHPVTLVRKRSYGGVYLEGEEWVAEASGVVGCACLPHFA